MTRLARLVPLALAVSVLAGCPEERPDAKRPLPKDRFPPAMPVQPRRETIGPAPTPLPAVPGPTATPDAAPADAPAPAR